ncbi:autotransporter outer membrane beta-barrel domain-containing protein [uncultured Hyphomicrobium sp.]|uniref:autotransporter family protein n=1 Tax=uncultured Hyphomicrobium sp. TaxID=194373 RepID=UPI0025EE4DC0|nr:autotransporter outer membrane beta-barrel domain-containing protein [uncultured Hyphomicrobium sp.]
MSLPHWSVGSDLDVGSPSPAVGTLVIQGGGTVTNDTGFIGNGVSEQGEVTVSGHDGSGNASTWTNNGDLVVGQDGMGMLRIEDGGVVYNDWGYVGAGAGSQGEVIVSGRDINGNASTWTSSGQVYIGDNGAGLLTILDGGVVNSGLASIGANVGGTGTVVISGRDINGNASTWNVTNQIYIGDGGINNTLGVLDGGALNSGQGLIGYSSGGEGSVVVSGRDVNGNASIWNAANNIYVGFSGDGTLDIEDGAAVSTSASGGGAAAVFIGYAAGGTGTVTVSSSTGDFSSLTATDRIEVGSDGTGTMTVGKGGFVSVGSDVRIANGSTSSGTLHLNGDATGRGIVETGSVIHGLGATAILDLNGGILRATRDEANFLNGFATLTIGAEGAWFDSNAHDIAVSTDFSGTSSFNKLGLGKLTLTGDSSGFIGAATVSAGTLAVNGVVGGTMAVVGGRLQGIGQVGDTTNFAAGTVAPGNSIGVLTVAGNYVGNGGTLEIETVLGGDSSPSDVLVVTGDTSGNTSVRVINLGGAGAQTIEGIKIVDVGGVSGGQFTLLGNYMFQGDPAVVAGAYAYRLHQGSVSAPADGDWYLRSSLFDTAGPSTPLYQPGAPIYEAYPAVLQSFNELGTLQQRVGNRTWSNGAVETVARPDAASGTWARIVASHANADSKFSTTRADYESDAWQLQAGADGQFYAGDAGELIGGLWARYGTISSNVGSIFGAGSIDSTGYGMGGALTWYGAGGFYLDGQAGLTRYDSDLFSSTAATRLVEGNNGFGYALGLEAGQQIAFGSNWSVTPQVQLVYSEIDFEDFADVFAAAVSLADGDRLKARLGISADYQNRWTGETGETSRLHAYWIANLYYDFRPETAAHLAGVSLINEREALWGGVGAGGTYSWADSKYAIRGEAALNTSLIDFADSYDVTGTVGFDVSF